MKLSKLIFLAFCASSFLVFSYDDSDVAEPTGARQLVPNDSAFGRRASWDHLIHMPGLFEPLTLSLLFVSESDQPAIFAINFPGGSDSSATLVSIAPRATLCSRIGEFIAFDSWPDYFTIRQVGGDKRTTVRLVYENGEKEGNQAIVKPAFNRSTNWLLFPSNWDMVTDRLVIFNPNKATASIFLRQLNAEGLLLEEKELASLPGLGKQQVLVGSPSSSLFDAVPGCSYQIVSNLPITLTGLSSPDCNEGILWELPVQVK